MRAAKFQSIAEVRPNHDLKADRQDSIAITSALADQPRLRETGKQRWRGAGCCVQNKGSRALLVAWGGLELGSGPLVLGTVSKDVFFSCIAFWP